MTGLARPCKPNKQDMSLQTRTSSDARLGSRLDGVLLGEGKAIANEQQLPAQKRGERAKRSKPRPTQPLF